MTIGSTKRSRKHQSKRSRKHQSKRQAAWRKEWRKRQRHIRQRLDKKHREPDDGLSGE